MRIAVALFLAVACTHHTMGSPDATMTHDAAVDAAPGTCAPDNTFCDFGQIPGDPAQWPGVCVANTCRGQCIAKYQSTNGCPSPEVAMHTTTGVCYCQ